MLGPMISGKSRIVGLRSQPVSQVHHRSRIALQQELLLIQANFAMDWGYASHRALGHVAA